MLRDFGERENSHVRDLVDLVILREQGLLDPAVLAEAVRQVWLERDATPPPTSLPSLPVSWPDRYERLAAAHGLSATTFLSAIVIVSTLWAEMFPTEAT